MKFKAKLSAVGFGLPTALSVFKSFCRGSRNSWKRLPGCFRWSRRDHPKSYFGSDGHRTRLPKMESIQVNGQRIWGPPSNWTGPPPPHGTEVYIKNIPENVMEVELYQIFYSVGEIYEVRVPVHWNGYNRGYAFVRFTKMKYADRAIREFDKLGIQKGWRLKVERSIDNNRLFLSAVPNYKSGEDIKNDLKSVVDNVRKVYVYTALENPSIYRGYAFVEFHCHRDAAIAKRILTPDVCAMLFERKCIAAWANPLPYLNEEILEKINILFIRNVPLDLKGITMKMLVEKLVGVGTVEKVKRLYDMAFLTFKDHDCANFAMEKMRCNPKFLGNREIQVEWAVPRDLARPVVSTHKQTQQIDPSLLLEMFYRSYFIDDDKTNMKMINFIDDIPVKTMTEKTAPMVATNMKNIWKRIGNDILVNKISPGNYYNSNIIRYEVNKFGEFKSNKMQDTFVLDDAGESYVDKWLAKCTVSQPSDVQTLYTV